MAKARRYPQMFPPMGADGTAQMFFRDRGREKEREREREGDRKREK